MKESKNMIQSNGASNEVPLQDVFMHNLRIALASENKNRQQLADSMNISKSSLSQKFSGKIRWTLEDIEKAAEFLKVNPATLLVAGHGFEPWTSGL